VTRDDQLELAALVGLAWEQREDPEALRAAVAKVEDWHDRRSIRAWERRQRSTAAVFQVLRETDPDPERRAGV
jgi:hypothetical protein